jgi:MazG family protein
MTENTTNALCDVDGSPPTLDRALDLVRFLRANCEWDAVQTPESLLPYLLEESHEVADAVADKDDFNLTGELGDLLLNVAFQIVLAEERAAFYAEDVVKTLEVKMRRRHPHLYGDGPKTPWEELKQRERELIAADRAAARAAAGIAETAADESPGSVLKGVPRGLDPLSRAHRIQDRVASVGFDWPDIEGPLDKVREEIDEVREALDSGDTDAFEDELGDLLFAIVNFARKAGVHPTGALERANRKFIARFEGVEKLAAARGLKLGAASLEELDVLWDEVKKADGRDGATE